MSTFALNKRTASIESPVTKSKKTIEIMSQGGDEYVLLRHDGDNVYELADLTKEELRTIWRMLTVK
jgi:hypothetical protein